MAWASLLAYLLGLSTQHRVKPHAKPFSIENEFRPFPLTILPPSHTRWSSPVCMSFRPAIKQSELNNSYSKKALKLMIAIGFGWGLALCFLLCISLSASLFLSLCLLVSLMSASRLLDQTLNPTLELNPVPGCRARPKTQNKGLNHKRWFRPETFVLLRDRPHA